jgi:hypothetical protein
LSDAICRKLEFRDRDCQNHRKRDSPEGDPSESSLVGSSGLPDDPFAAV